MVNTAVNPMNPGDFTRGTSEASVDQFNQWMRSQPFYQQIRQGRTGDFSKDERAAIGTALQSQGINVGKDFTIDKGGNLNQTNRTASRIGTGIKLAGLAAAPFTGGTTAALVGATSGGLGSALQGKGLKGSLMGAATGAGSAAGLSKLGGMAGLHATGSGAQTAASMLNDPFHRLASGVPDAINAAPGAANVGGKVGWFNNILNAGKTATDATGKGKLPVSAFADASKLLGTYAQTQAANRTARAQLAQEQDSARLLAEQNQRTAQANAMNDLRRANWIASGGLNLNIPGYTYQGYSPEQVAAAQELAKQASAAVKPGANWQPSDYTKFATPGAAEKATGYGSLAAAGLQLASDLFGKKA